MSEDYSAKALRASNAAKAKRLADGSDATKVDCSDFSPAEPLNADKQTGAKPVSRRAFKAGGKVGMKAEGSCGPKRLDRPGRAPGGRRNGNTSADPGMDRDITRGIPGLLPKRAEGEDRQPHNPPPQPSSPPSYEEDMTKGIEGLLPARKMGGKVKKAAGGLTDAMKASGALPVRKHGGKVKKADGGSMDPRVGAGEKIEDAAKQGNVPVSRMDFNPARKAGGKVWEGSEKDEAQDKKLANKHGMSMKAWEKSDMDKKHDAQKSMKGLKRGGYAEGSAVDVAEDKRLAKKHGMSIKTWEKSEMDEEHDEPASMKRKARAYGGSLMADSPKKKSSKGGKGKTNIVISINAGGQQPAAPGAPPPPPKGVPVPVPPPGGPQGGPPPGAAPGAPPPMAMPPMGGAGGPPPGMMPPQMPRKAGGRVFPKMKAGAGSGEGRLEKTEAYGLKPKGK